MNIIEHKIRSQNLFKIKKIVEKDKDGDHFIIIRKDKNLSFMREYGLSDEDVKSIVKGLTVEDCFSGPEKDRDPKYKGWIFKFSPLYEQTKLYIKIRIENLEKSVCLSVHEFNKY